MTPRRFLKLRLVHVGQVAEGLGKALSLVLGVRGADGLGETEAAGRRKMGFAADCGQKRSPQSTVWPYPYFPAPAPPSLPTPRPIRSQDSPASSLREPSQLPRYLPCAPDPLPVSS